MLEDAIRKWNAWWVDGEALNVLAGIERSRTAEILERMSLPHVKDIIGVRRSGKTTIMYQVIKSLLNSGTKPKEVVFLNFDDPEINAASFEQIQKSIVKINPDAKYLFIDEVQQKVGWERWIRAFYDTRAFGQIVVSGSSAALLSAEIGRVLTGRHITFLVFPFSFRETLKFSDCGNFNSCFLEFKKNELLHHQENYIKNGGFPEVAGKTDSERKLILTNVYNDILSRDISSRFGVSFEAVKKVSYHLLSNVANEFSYRSVANAAGLTVETVEKHIGFLKESFIVLVLDFFSYKTKVQFKQNKKAYCIDTGLRNAVSFRFSEDLGRLAENVVLVELKRREAEVYYWKDRSGNEVDFLVKQGLHVQELIQVCWKTEEPGVLKREIKGLAAGLEEFNLKEGIVITEDREGEEMLGGRKIRYLPLWKWLLTI